MEDVDDEWTHAFDEDLELPDLKRRVSSLANSNDTHKDITINFTADEFSVDGEVKDVSIAGGFTDWTP